MWTAPRQLTTATQPNDEFLPLEEITPPTEQECKEWDEHEKEDHTYKLSPERRRRYKGRWYLTLNKAVKKWACEASI